MFDWKNFPWTDFQDLNLDWILRKIKELTIVDLPALDKKIDNVYQYIEENLPEIVAQIATVVIDVKAAGAVGDGVTDDTDAIKNAIAMGKIIFFPPGTYCFQSISVDKPLAVWGSGDQSILQPMHKHPLTNQTYCLFDFHDTAIMSDLQIRPDNSVVSESGTKYPTEAALRAHNSPHIHLERITFDNFFSSYRSGQPAEFSDREGMAIGFHDCLEVCIEDCHFKEHGDEEYIWINQNRGNYARGKVTFNGCEFGPKNNNYSGSYLNVLGGYIEFSNNYMHDVRLCNADSSVGWTAHNMMCPWVNIHDNVFRDNAVGSYIDLSEGYYNKVEEAIISNNIMTGTCNRCLQAMTRNLIIVGNHIQGGTILRTWTETTLPTYGTYCVDNNTVFDFDNVIIKNNYLHCNKYLVDQTGNMATCIGLGQAVNYATYKYIDFSDNTVNVDDDSTIQNTIFYASPCVKAVISNNIFNGCGVSTPSSSGLPNARGIVGGHGGITNLIVKGNYVDSARYIPASTVLVNGDSAFKPLTYFEECFNRGTGINTSDPDHPIPYLRSQMASLSAWTRGRDCDLNSNMYEVP